MPSVHFNYNNWQFWRDSDGDNLAYGGGARTFPNQKVAFDGERKIIFVNEGVTELNVKDDVYSAWKEWLLASPEYPYAAGWLNAISAIGGEPLTDNLNVGSTFFLENGWRIQPKESRTPYLLNVVGNIYTREAGENPFLFANGCSVNLTRSNLVDQLVATSSITQQDYDNIASAVWQLSKNTNTGPASFGQLVNDIDSDLTIVDSKVDKALTVGEFLALK